MIRCEDALRELWGYLCDEVTPESRARIAEHLDACRRCCGEIAFLGELRRVLAVIGDRSCPPTSASGWRRSWRPWRGAPMTDLMHKAEIQEMVRAAYRTVDVPRGAGAVYYARRRPRGPARRSGRLVARRRQPAGPRGAAAGLHRARRRLRRRHRRPARRAAGRPRRARDRPGPAAGDGRAGAGECPRGRGWRTSSSSKGRWRPSPFPTTPSTRSSPTGWSTCRRGRCGRCSSAPACCAPAVTSASPTSRSTRSDLPPEVLLHPAAWSGCAAGAMAERALLRALGRVGLVDVEVRERHPFGVEDCARFPLFTPELLAVMRATIPPERQPTIATVITVTARQPDKDAPRREVVASPPSAQHARAPRPSWRAWRTRSGSSAPATAPAVTASAATCAPGGRPVPPGTRTVVTMRDPSTKADVPSLARMLGHCVEDMTETGGTLRVTIRTKGDPA